MTRPLLVIPGYNCAPQIGRVLQAIDDTLLARVSRVTVIDNQSTDGTGERAVEVARQLGWEGIDVYRNDANYGLGGSWELGVRRARELGCDTMVFLHGDAQAPTSQVHRMLDALEGSPTLVAALGARFLRDSERMGYSRLREWANRCLNVVATKTTGRAISDLGSGLNAYRVAALDDQLLASLPDHIAFDNRAWLLNLPAHLFLDAELEPDFLQEYLIEVPHVLTLDSGHLPDADSDIRRIETLGNVLQRHQDQASALDDWINNYRAQQHYFPPSTPLSDRTNIAIIAAPEIPWETINRVLFTAGQERYNGLMIVGRAGDRLRATHAFAPEYWDHAGCALQGAQVITESGGWLNLGNFPALVGPGGCTDSDWSAIFSALDDLRTQCQPHWQALLDEHHATRSDRLAVFLVAVAIDFVSEGIQHARMNGCLEIVAVRSPALERFKPIVVVIAHHQTLRRAPVAVVEVGVVALLARLFDSVTALRLDQDVVLTLGSRHLVVRGRDRALPGLAADRDALREREVRVARLRTADRPGHLVSQVVPVQICRHRLEIAGQRVAPVGRIWSHHHRRHRRRGVLHDLGARPARRAVGLAVPRHR